MNLKLRVLVVGEDRKGRIAGAGTNFQDDLGASLFFCYAGQDGELLLEPFSVLEKVGGVVLVEKIPPLFGIPIESA